MSYILDALKKSEQQRGHGNIPDVQTVHSSSLNYQSDKKIYWPYILLFAVLLNLLAIIYFIFDKEENSEIHTKTQQNEALESETPVLNAADNLHPVITPDDKKQENTVTQAVNSNIEHQEKNKQSEETSTVIAPTTTKSSEDGAGMSSNKPENIAVKNQAQGVGSTILEYYDLPESIKQQIPAIIISAHVYSSNPLQRSIVINNNFMEEGDYVIDDLILYEITTDGAIFNNKGTLFHYGVVSTWQ